MIFSKVEISLPMGLIFLKNLSATLSGLCASALECIYQYEHYVLVLVLQR